MEVREESLHEVMVQHKAQRFFWEQYGKIWAIFEENPLKDDIPLPASGKHLLVHLLLESHEGVKPLKLASVKKDNLTRAFRQAKVHLQLLRQNMKKRDPWRFDALMSELKDFYEYLNQ